MEDDQLRLEALKIAVARAPSSVEVVLAEAERFVSFLRDGDGRRVVAPPPPERKGPGRPRKQV